MVTDMVVRVLEAEDGKAAGSDIIQPWSMSIAPWFIIHMLTAP